MEKLEALTIVGAVNINRPPSSPEYYHKVIEAYNALGRVNDAEEYERIYGFVIAIKEGRVAGVCSE